jgi:PAS domain S-box-containing protein
MIDLGAGALTKNLAGSFDLTASADRLLTAVLDCVAQPLAVVDHEGRIVSLNPAALAALGYDDLEELRGRDGHDALHYKHPDGSPFPLEECPLVHCRDRGERVVVEEDWWVRKDGSMIALCYTATPIPTEGGYGSVVVFTELEKRRALERAMHARATQRRILEAGDPARRRLASDLHDGAQQRFVNAAIRIQLAEHHLNEGQLERGRELLGIGLQQTREGIEELRLLVAGIHPAILVSRGLGAAIEGLAERLPMPARVQCSLSGRLPRAVEESAYFIVSEALTNVVKHAGATEVAVSLEQEDGRLRVEVADNGDGGIDVARGHGTGLASLHDRVSALDGDLEIITPPGEGTVVRASVPID